MKLFNSYREKDPYQSSHGYNAFLDIEATHAGGIFVVRLVFYYRILSAKELSIAIKAFYEDTVSYFEL